MPAATVGLMLSFTTVVVATLGVVFLKEVPNTKQILLIIAAFVGALIYFHPFGSQDLGETAGWGLLVVGIGVLANGVAQLQGRDLNRTRTACPLVVTATSMAFGTIVLFVIALFVEGMPDFSIKAIVFILWLAVVNTALAFTMWNHALTKLEAAEIAIINNTMLAQVAILAAIFLAEIPDTLEWIGLTMVAVTALLYQLAAKPRNRELGLKPLNDEICVEQVEMDEE